MTNSEGAETLLASVHQPTYEIGDMVFAYGTDVCPITNRVTSRYGYTSYKGRYVTAPLLPEVPEDWFPARYVRRLYTKKQLREGMRKRLQEAGATSEELASIEAATDTDKEMAEVLRRTFSHLEERGLLRQKIKEIVERLRSGRWEAEQSDRGATSPTPVSSITTWWGA